MTGSRSDAAVSSLDVTPPGAASCRSPLGTYPECPLCGGGLHAEHAHFKCRACGWRDSCCD